MRREGDSLEEERGVARLGGGRAGQWKRNMNKNNVIYVSKCHSETYYFIC